MGRACSIHERCEIPTVLVEKSEDRVVLKRTLQEYCEILWSGFT
jgi:hypothetical protein